MKSLAVKFMPAQGLEGRTYYAIRGRGSTLVYMFAMSNAFGSAFALRNSIKRSMRASICG